MRIISIGCPVPSPSVDNHSIANAPSDLRLRRLHHRPAAGLRTDRGDRRQHAQREGGGRAAGRRGGVGRVPLRTRRAAAAAPVGADAADGSRRRADRIPLSERAALGRCGVRGAGPVLDHPRARGRPVPLADAAARRRQGRASERRAASGERVSGRPLGRLRYRALLDLPADSAAEVVGRSIGDAVVAAEFRVGAGRLVVLPPPDNLAASQRKTFSASLLEMIERLLEDPEAASAPVWFGVMTRRRRRRRGTS